LERSSLVIGGGVAGMAAAVALADSGIKVYLVEREPFLGGHGAFFSCKATDKCATCGLCLLPQMLSRTTTYPQISLLFRSTLIGLTKHNGGFRAELTQRPRYVDLNKCTSCGACLEVCPTRAIRMPSPEAPPSACFIDDSKCLSLKGEHCVLCQERCPTGAVVFDDSSKRLGLDVGAIIVATGFEAFEARRKGSLGYGHYHNVLTGLDLERMFNREGALKLPSSKQPKDIAFIQCVGSRDESQGSGYCSQVCCKYATRFARLIKHQDPEAKVTIFYIDLQTAGKGFAEFFEECRGQIRFVRGIPVEVTGAAGDRLMVRFEDSAQGKQLKEEFDLVVLSTGIGPRKDSWGLAKVLGVNLDEYGFFDSPDGVETNVEGVFLAGTCQGPKDIPGSIAHGQAAAERAVPFLGRAFHR